MFKTPAWLRKSLGPEAALDWIWSTIVPPLIVTAAEAAVPRSKLASAVDVLPTVLAVTVPPVCVYVIVDAAALTPNRPVTLIAPPSTIVVEPTWRLSELSKAVPTLNVPAETRSRPDCVKLPARAGTVKFGLSSHSPPVAGIDVCSVRTLLIVGAADPSRAVRRGQERGRIGRDALH